MARRKLDRQIEEGLKQLAFGEISDAVALLYMSDEEALQKLPTLNLFNVSEIKRPRGGGMEIKFFDRIKACERLRADIPADTGMGAGFIKALERSAQSIRGVPDDDA